MRGIKTNRTENGSLELVSYIHDGEYKVLKKDGNASGNKVSFMESSTLKEMLNKYMTSRFANLSPDGSTKIKISLNDFSFSNYTTESAGGQVLRALFGTTGGQPFLMSARISVSIEIDRNGEILEQKNIQATAERNYFYNRDAAVKQFKQEGALVVNEANNKVLMLLNSYFEELEL